MKIITKKDDSLFEKIRAWATVISLAVLILSLLAFSHYYRFKHYQKMQKDLTIWEYMVWHSR